MFGLQNVGRGWITSLIGLVIIIAALASVFTKHATWGDAALGMAVGVGLLGLPDPKKPGTGVVGALALALVFGGCASIEKVQRKYGTQGPPTTLELSDTVKVPVAVTTKADSLDHTMSMDSLAAAPVGDTLKLISVGGQAKVSIWKSAPTKPGGSHQLHTRVEVPPQIIHDTIEKVVTLQGKCPPTWTITKVSNPWYQPYWGYFQDFCTALFLVVLLVIVIVLLVRSARPRIPFLLVAGLALGGLAACHTTQPVPTSTAKFRPQPLDKTIHRNLHR